jgi:mono/diheme cytochrome c family protein
VKVVRTLPAPLSPGPALSYDGRKATATKTNGNGGNPMKPSVCLATGWLMALPQLACAQVVLDDTQKLGQRLFEQSCGICHTRPTLVSGLYGPALSKEAAGGRTEVVRDVISNGTPRMPGFKYTYDAGQIAAIAAYLAIMPVPAAMAAPAAPQGAPRDDN